MASIGNLVVNLTAKTDKFRKGMRGARASLARFAKASAAIGGVAGVGILKLAADAETLEVKFRVLLKSGDKAKSMIQDISKFAAATPFQKMEIGEAAQKLLAFNVPADRVMGTLKNIGDISALTGNRISEMAELYGKANVQGRLFGEDINQLTGRGIPIIQELAKQFGVAESEVKGLVEAGDVSARNIEIAFQNMTSAGGQFAGGMAQLSETTAGKFSTLKDNIAEVGVQVGTSLLPAANAVLEALTTLAKGFDKVSDFGKSAFRAVEDAVGDVSTVAFVVANNMGNIWKGAFKDVPKFAGAAFDWVRENAVTMMDNLVAMAKAFPGILDSIGRNLGEEFAFAVGLSDEKLQFDPLREFRAKKLTEFKMPEFSPETQGVLNDIGGALDEAKRQREAARAGTDAAKATLDIPQLEAFDPEGVGNAIADATKEGQRGLIASQQRGSTEALTTILKAQQTTKKAPQVQEQQTTNKILRGMAAVLDRQRERDILVQEAVT